MGCGSSSATGVRISQEIDGKIMGKSTSSASDLSVGQDMGRSSTISETVRVKITDVYDIDDQKLGEGSFGCVMKATHKTTNSVRAVKQISKARARKEASIMQMLDHPNIIKFFESFEDSRNIYLIMEKCDGGELFDRVIHAGHLTEVQAATLMQQIFRAIHYIHENNICHRDLKPDNFLFLTRESVDKSPLKMIDFGLSCTFTTDKVLTTKAGTPYYVAPQVLSGKYDNLSDMWSCGVIMYALLCGYPPFYGRAEAEILRKIRVGYYTFLEADWKDVSEDAKDLIRKLLKMKPTERYTSEQALSHTWVKDGAPQATHAQLQPSLMDNLRDFRGEQLRAARISCEVDRVLSA